MKWFDTDLHPPLRLSLCSFSSGSQSSSSQPTLNPQLYSLFEANAQRAAGVANKPFTPYTGQTTAGQTDAQTQALGLLQNGATSAGSGALNTGVNAATAATNYTAPQITAPTIDRNSVQNVTSQTGLGDISQYMNPYTASVTNTTLADLNRAREQAINQGQSNATLSHAYGGSRQGVSDSLTNQDYLNTAASTLANLNSQGFNTAAGLLQNDQNRSLAANQANQGADLSVANTNANNGLQGLLANQSASLQGQGYNLQGAGLLNTLGNSQSSNFLNATNALSQAGAQQQQTQQSGLDAAYQEFLRQQGYDPQMQQLINQALGMVPTGLGQSSSGSSSNFGLSLAGLGGK